MEPSVIKQLKYDFAWQANRKDRLSDITTYKNKVNRSLENI